jgi:hypothetical protein
VAIDDHVGRDRERLPDDTLHRVAPAVELGPDRRDDDAAARFLSASWLHAWASFGASSRLATVLYLLSYQ